MHTLIVCLILVALVPNLTLGAIFWLGIANMPLSGLAPMRVEPAPQASIPAAVLTTPGIIEAATGESVSFPIALDGTDGVPRSSVIVISGLPQGSTFSDGASYGETEWILKPDEIGDLHFVLPNPARGVSRLSIKLVGPDDKIITQADTILEMVSRPDANVENGTAPVASDPISRGVKEMKSATPELGALRAPDESIAKPETSTRPSEGPGKLPKTGVASAEVNPKWIRPSSSVNLRDGPSPSAPIIGVVAKGARLSVVSRKGRWVQITNPATGKSGWLYAGHLAIITRRSAKKQLRQRLRLEGAA
jgi:hypothetical protein